jgi:2-succinyl-5-enolpyruvyl-6-hydroxy-3-cyclohexene-1-carboxylate synthase
MNTPQSAYLYIGAFVDELARSGLQHVVVCPGSRSTPLAIMLAEEPRLKLWLHLDERSAAFFALGMAKALRAPVALLCTSGTAAANFFPAIVEAHYSRVPLIVLTADRPPELRDTGAPQTIDQLRLYGDYPDWFVEMALPEATPDALRYARTIACRAVLTHGIVHINFPFREPLVPEPVEISFDEKDRSAYQGRADGSPYVRAVTPPRPSFSANLDLLARLRDTERGLIVIGPNTDPELVNTVTDLSLALGYPLLADPLSQARCGKHNRANLIDSYDAFLRDPATVERLAPEVVLRFGAMPTSKPVLQYLQRYPDAQQILFGDDWQDPTRLASQTSEVFKTSEVSMKETPWLALWRIIQSRARAVISDHLLTVDEFFEGRVFAQLADHLPSGSTLWASSSMPVRDLDTFFPGNDRILRFLSNRGANGIDGVVSSALGAKAVTNDPLFLVIGDIAFYHDLNGLLAAKLHQLNATIILINNDGGGIFSFLPQSAHPKHFEQLFGTPHGIDFEPVAKLYGATYCRPKDWAEFRSAVVETLPAPPLRIVEIRTDRQRNVELHRAIWPKVAEALRVI